MAEPAISARDLVRWSEALAGVARTGLAFTESLYERERFEEILKVAADMSMLKADASQVKRDLGVKYAESRADRLEWEAGFAIDYAIASVRAGQVGRSGCDR